MTLSNTTRLLLLISNLGLSNGFVHLSPRLFHRPSVIVTRDSNDPIEFSDFGDFVPGDDSSSMQNTQQLRERVDQVRQEQVQQDANLQKNWSMGNWKVRGFSLDQFSAVVTEGAKDEESADAISISQLAQGDEDDDTIVVGRTDGSVCLVALGTAYLTQFESKLKAVETSNETVSIESTLVPNHDDDDDGNTDIQFSVLHQFMAHQGQEITSLLMVQQDNQHDATIVIVGDAWGLISVWSIPTDDDERVLPLRNLEAHHSNDIVALKTVSLDGNELLFSASRDGSVALWDLWTGDLVYHCELGEAITCADVFDNQIYLGLASGAVVAYIVNDMVQAASEGGTCPVPNGRFQAVGDASVTSIVCGDATDDRYGTTLVTGGEDGSVIQWQMIQRTSSDDSSTVLEHWPRLATQRMPQKAHVFGKGHGAAVTALLYCSKDLVVSAGIDGTVRAWSPKTGKELYTMDGFDPTINSLVLEDDSLVTNGMKQFVCVHDFNVDVNEYEEGFELEW